MRNFLLAFVVVILLVACNNGVQKNKGMFAFKLFKIFGGSKTADSTMALPFSLHYRVGTMMSYTVSTEDETTVETSEKKITNVSKTDIRLVYEVIKDSGSQYLIKLTFDKIHQYSKKDDVEKDLDADNGKISIDPAERILGVMKSAPLWVTMNQKGKVLNVDGYKVMEDSLLKATGVKANNEEVAYFQKKLEKLVDEGFIKNILEQGVGIFPEKPVNEGDKWSRKESQTISGLKMDENTTYKLVSVEDGMINLTAETQIDNQGTDLKTMGYSVNTSLHGDANSSYDIESATGFLVGSKQESTLKGTLQMMGQELPIKIRSTKLVGVRKL